MEFPAPNRKATEDPTNDVTQYDATGCSGNIHASAQYQMPRQMFTAENPMAYMITNRTMAKDGVTFASETLPPGSTSTRGTHAPDQSMITPKKSKAMPIK